MRFYIFAAILFLFFTAKAEVFFVPGWLTGFTPRTGSVRILKDIYPGRKISVCSWDSRRSWKITKLNSLNQKDKLLRDIVAMPEQRRENLILVGHSIGAEIVVDILSKLAQRNLKIHSAALLAGALPCDDLRIPAALKAVKNHICCIYNPDDGILKYLYPLDFSGIAPLGSIGWPGKNDRFFEMRSGSPNHTLFNHFAYIYLEALDELMDTIPPNIPDIPVEQDQPNTEIKPVDGIFWSDEEIFQNWKLQKHYSGKYRILSPYNIRKAQGREKQIRQSFSKIKSDLLQKVNK